MFQVDMAGAGIDPSIGQDATLLGALVYGLIEAVDVHRKPISSSRKKALAPLLSGGASAALHVVKVFEGSQPFSTSAIMILAMGTYGVATGLHSAAEKRKGGRGR
jgi:hypothetical protein